MASHVAILMLEANSGVKKLSVSYQDSAEIISIFNVEKTLRQVVQCHSSTCNMRKGSKRNIVELNDKNELCDHLTLFRQFFIENRQLFPVDDADEKCCSFLPHQKVLLLLLISPPEFYVRIYLLIAPYVCNSSPLTFS